MNWVKMQMMPDDGNAAGGGVDPTPVDSEEAAEYKQLVEDVFSDELPDEDTTVEETVNDDIEFGPVESAAVSENVAPASVATKPAEAPISPVQPVESIDTPPLETQNVSQVPLIPEQPKLAESPLESHENLRKSALSELEKRYSLSKEDADAMISEPETVVPRLMSQMYLDVYDNIMRSIQVYLPHMVQHVNHYSTAQQKDESDFYAKWPGLKEHNQKVLEIGQQYRAMNPTATKEQFIQDVGLHASIALKIPLEGFPPPPATVVNPPYVPPRGGPVSPPSAKPPVKGQFAALADEWEELERL